MKYSKGGIWSLSTNWIPFRGEDGRVGDDPVKPLRMVGGELEGDDRPVAPADHVRLGDTQVVEQPHGVGGHLLVGDRQVAPGRAAAAAAIHRHDPVAGGDQHRRQVVEFLGLLRLPCSSSTG